MVQRCCVPVVVVAPKPARCGWGVATARLDRSPHPEGASMGTDVFIVAGARTAFGRYGGGLSHMRLDDMLGTVLVAACERAGVPLDQVDEVAAGCVNVAHEGMGDLGRWAALAAGFPDSVPGYTVNRF